MTIEEQIKQIIQDTFDPTHMELINESKKHVGHAGDDGSGQTHFKLKVVSSAFDSCTRVERQRKVNASVNHLFEQGLHAISLKLVTPKEFQVK